MLLDAKACFKRIKSIEKRAQKLEEERKDILNNLVKNCSYTTCDQFQRPFSILPDTDEYGRHIDVTGVRYWGKVCALCGKRNLDISVAEHNQLEKQHIPEHLSYLEKNKIRFSTSFQWYKILIEEK